MADQVTINRLRRMTGVPASEWSDSELSQYLASTLIEDGEGNKPGHEDYIDTHDLHRAASQVFRDRAAAVADVAYDTQVDMTKAERSQIVDNYLRMARHHEMHAVPRWAGASDMFAQTPLLPRDNISADA